MAAISIALALVLLAVLLVIPLRDQEIEAQYKTGSIHRKWSLNSLWIPCSDFLFRYTFS